MTLRIVTLVALIVAPTLALAEPLRITVEQAVERAMTENPRLRISKAALEEQAANAWQATTSRLPRVDLSGGVTRFDADLFGSESFVTIKEQRSAQLRATHNLFSGGRTHGLAKVSRSLAEVAKHDYSAQKLITQQVVRQAFYDAQLAQKLLEVANEAVEINREELRRAKVQLEIGEAAKINLLRAEVQLANSLPNALNAKQNLRLAKNDLANLIAYDLDPTDIDVTELELVGDLESSRRLLLPGLGRLIQAAHDNRPELKRAHAQVNAARGEAQTKWSALLPRVDLYGAYNWRGADGQFDAQSTTIDTTTWNLVSSPLGTQEFSSNNSGWEIGATASMPLFDFFGNVKGVKAGRAKVHQAEIAEEDLKRQVDLSVRASYSGYLETVELVVSQDKNIERARESLRLARQLQEAGEATQLDVQQAQLDLTQARSLFVQAARDLMMAETSLLISFGLATIEEAGRYGVSVQQ